MKILNCIQHTIAPEQLDELQADGSVIKRAIFRHVKFVEVYV